MSLSFWFDVHSPWCYLAAHRIGDLARRHGLPLDWRPLHLPTLQQAIGGRQPLRENKAFVAWYQQDLRDWAALQGLPVAYHPSYPLRNSRALRVCLFAADQAKGEACTKRILRAYWAEGGNIEDQELLGAWAEEAGLDRGAAIAATQDLELKARIETNTREAQARGVFGVPTVDTGAKLYFGNDRLELLDIHLRQGSLRL